MNDYYKIQRLVDTNRLIEEIVSGSEGIQEISVLDKEGVVVYSNLKQEIGKSRGDLIKKLKYVSKVFGNLAKGDLTQKIDIELKEKEIFDMAMSFNSSIENISEIIMDFKNLAQTVASSAEELSVVSEQLVTGSTKMSEQLVNVGGATEQVSTGINTMASVTEQMSVNIVSISNAAEQMSINMNAVSGSIEKMTQSIPSFPGGPSTSC